MSSPKTVDSNHGPTYTPDINLLKTVRMDREELMDITNDLIRFLQARIMKERFKEQKGDRIRLAYARVELSAIQAYAKLLKDEQIDELQKRIEALENLKPRQR